MTMNSSFDSPVQKSTCWNKPGNTVFCLQCALTEAAFLITWLNGLWLARFISFSWAPYSRNSSSIMASDSDYTRSMQKVEVRYGYLMIFSTIIVFHSLNNLVARYVGTPKSVRNDPWRWRNLFISWIHGMICGSWNILWYD